MKETESKSAMGLIMNPQSGAILAMSSVPSFDNNNFSQFSISQHHSKVLTDQFEPASTFKIVAATASLAENKISLEQEFSCENGKFDYFGSIIKDHDPYEQLTISQIIKHSSNIGIIKIAEEVGSNSIYKYAKLFGFGTPTNFDMAGETAGKIKPEKEWSRISIGQISMGHEVAVNALQLAVAFSAIANNGFLVKPYIVDKIYNKDKNWKKRNIKARFKCALSIYGPGFKTVSVIGKIEGTISKKKLGSLGFGYDPIFIPIGKKITFGQMRPEMKHKIDHRFKAFKKIRKFF